MTRLIIYHNGACSKSKGALELLIGKNIPHTIRWYMEDPLSAKELDTILIRLGLPVSAIIRTNEDLYSQIPERYFLNEDSCKSILLRYPSLMQRPIVVYENKAVIARPAERIFELIPPAIDLPY